MSLSHSQPKPQTAKLIGKIVNIRRNPKINKFEEGMKLIKSRGAGSRINKVYIIPIFILLLLILPSVMAEAQDIEEVRGYIRLVYHKVSEAEKSGAEVEEAALKLNQALSLIREAEGETNTTKRNRDLTEAHNLVKDVEASIDRLVEEGRARINLRNITLSSTAILAAAGCILGYIYAPRIFWSLWLRLRRGWRVKRA